MSQEERKGGRGNPEIKRPNREIPQRVRQLVGPERPVVGTSEIADTFGISRQAILPYLDDIKGGALESVTIGRTKCWFPRESQLTTEDEEGCQEPNCEDKAKQVYTDGLENQLRLCEDHYYELVAGPRRVSVTRDSRKTRDTFLGRLMGTE